MANIEAPSTDTLPMTSLTSRWLDEGTNSRASATNIRWLNQETAAAPPPAGLGPPGLFAVSSSAPRPPPPPVPARETQGVSSYPTSSKAEANKSVSRVGERPAPTPLPVQAVQPYLSRNLSGNSAASALNVSSMGDRKETFDTYLSDADVERGLRTGHFMRGTLRVSNSKLGTAYVNVESSRKAGASSKDSSGEKERDFVVKGKKARNRAVHGDVVVVKFLTEDDECHPRRQHSRQGLEAVAKVPTSAAAVSDSESEEEQVLLGGGLHCLDNDETSNKGGGKGGHGKVDGGTTIYVKVVAIAEKKGTDRIIVCTLHPNDKNSVAKNSKESRADGEVREDDKFLKAKPTDQRMPWILVPINDVTRKILEIPEKKLNKFQFWPIQIMTWKESSSLPLGRIKGHSLGMAGDLVAEEKHALIEQELDEHDVDFQEEQVEEVDEIVRKAKNEFEQEVARRNDLQGRRIFTIDPATAKDLDDAIHVDRVPGGKQIEVGVHIADVGHFVKTGTLTDTEAQRRTTSVYLINRVIPMLPHGLCNHLCSLNPNEPKLAFSAFFRLDCATGEICEDEDSAPWFQKTAIKSCCRLNYEQVQDVLDGDEPRDGPIAVYGGHRWEQILDDMFLLYDVCGKVRRGRLEGGALAITKTKMVFHTRDSEDGMPSDYHFESHSASHWIIEELMLLANRCVAKHLANSALFEVAVLRNHQPPDPKKSEQLSKMLIENLGIEWPENYRDAGELHRACQGIYAKYGKMLGLCVEMMTMRGGMQQAEYFVYGPEANPHHFALNFDYYTHFTSPIRRYPDVMVHRILASLLESQESGQQDASKYQDVDAACEQVIICNEKKTASRRCQEQLERAVFCIYLRRMKEWFYTVGTVLGFQRDMNDKGNDSVTVYCSQLGKESKAKLVMQDETFGNLMEYYELFDDGVDDKLMLPKQWRFVGRGCVELTWEDEGSLDEKPERKRQVLNTLSCVPIVIIPTNTVPIDYALFFVSKFHPKYEQLNQQVYESAARGFQWNESQEDGVEVAYDAAGAD